MILLGLRPILRVAGLAVVVLVVVLTDAFVAVLKPGGSGKTRSQAPPPGAATPPFRCSSAARVSSER